MQLHCMLHTPHGHANNQYAELPEQQATTMQIFDMYHLELNRTEPRQSHRPPHS